MMKKRLCSVLLAFALLLTLLPTVAFAADSRKKIYLGTSGISASDVVHYGTNEQEWCVLDAEKTNTGENGLFLLSKDVLGRTLFLAENKIIPESTVAQQIWTRQSDGKPANTWQGSDAQEWCKDYASTTNFTGAELAAIPAVSKNDSEYRSGGWMSGASSLETEKIFFLSLEEYISYDDIIPKIKTYYYWLRSPSTFHSSFTVCSVSPVEPRPLYQPVYDDDNDPPVYARPAFSLNAGSILFTSAATGGKADDAVDKNLTAVGARSDNEWKLTLKDDSRSFSAEAASGTVLTKDYEYSNWSVSIDYSGARTGDNEYVSAMLVSSDNTVLYYGWIAQNTDSGTAEVTIPTGLAPGNYTLKVFNEQCNGGKNTDYASDFRDILLTVKPSTYNVTLDADGGTINSGTVTEYTYGEGATLPTDVTKTGYDFLGWYSGNKKVTSIGKTETGNKSFTAKWQANTYTVTLNAGDGTINSGDVTEYTYGQGAALPTDVTKTGYDFLGWYSGDEKVTSIGKTETGDKSFAAKWQANTYTITYGLDGGKAEGNPESYTIETETITLVNPTKSGYAFTGWSGTGLAGDENMTVTIGKGSTGDRTYTAHWRANRYYYYSDRQTAAPVTSPGTADDSAMGLWGLLLCASLAAGYAVTAAQRRRER